MPKIIKNVKEDLLTEGKKQLLSNGYLNLNIRNITKECNIGTGTFYNYCKNKEQLVIDILSNDWTSININDFLKNYRLIFSEMAKHTSKNHYVIEPMYETLEKLIEIHIEKGEINPPISSDKFAYFLLNNLILTSRSELTIDDLLLLLNI